MFFGEKDAQQMVSDELKQRGSEKISGENLINLFKSLIGNKINSQSQPNIEAIRVNLVEDPEIKTPKIKTPKAVQQIGDLERGLASLPEAIPTKVDLGRVETQLSDEQRKLIGQEKDKEYNLSGPDYQADVATFREKADEEKIISTPTDTSRYTFTPSQLYKGIKNNDEGLINNIYDAISKYEWRGKKPIFDFVAVDKDTKVKSSAFGPAQIVGDTAEYAMSKMKKGSEEYNFANKLQAAQKLFINLAEKFKKGKPLNAKNAESAANTDNAKKGKWLETLGITKEQFGKYVEQGYFIPSNQKAEKKDNKGKIKKIESKGIPPQIFGDNYKENYMKLFKTVLKEKQKESKTKSLEDVIQRYHGAKDKDKDESYQKGVFKNLFDTTNPYDKPIKDNETEIEVRPSYQPINTKKQSGGRIESDPYKRQPRFI